VFIPRKIGVSIYASIEIIIAVLPPPNLRVKLPSIIKVSDDMIAGSNLMMNIESPNNHFQIARTKIEKGG
jgi:hypothetical protein